jgi:hypothetical protein
MNKTHKLDKTCWPKGPWDNEPDRIDWVHQGFSCMMLRNHFGNWCGYVGVPSDHSCYKKNYDDVYVDVHGGLTYSSLCDKTGAICHTPEPGMPDDVWWLGFDCAHYNDMTPSLLYSDSPGTYRDVTYVKNEVCKLASQLNSM